MTESKYYEERRRLRKLILEADKARLDAEYELEMLEFGKNSAKSDTKGSGEDLAKFKTKYKKRLKQDDLIFLNSLEHSVQEVAFYADISERAVRKRLDEGKYRPGESDGQGRKRLICSLSVVEYKLNGDTQKKE